MKLEFLSEGSPDCPLIPLSSFTRRAALRLKQIVCQLSTGKLQEISLHDEAGIEPVHDCQLILRLSKHDKGITETGPLRFDCVLSDEGWLDVSTLLEPFCEADTNCFQWLVEKGPISLLISVKGTW